MEEQKMLLRTIQDLEAIEHVPLAARLSVRSTYELIREAATQDPERTAIVFLSEGDRLDRPEGISYGALLNGLHQTANLLADLGVGSQDVIALLLPDLLETHLLFWGGQAAGIVCPVHPQFPLEQTIALLRVTKARLLVAPGPGVDQELWQKAEEIRRQVKSVTMMLQVRGPGKERDGVYAFDALLEDYPSDRLHAGREIAAKQRLPFILLSDKGGTVRKRYGVAPTLGLLPGRVTYIIDKQGIVRHIFSSFFAPKKHAPEALKALQALVEERT